MNDFQQVFLRWLDLNRVNIAIPLFFEEFSNQTLRFRFEHMIQDIALFVTRNEIRIDVFKGEDHTRTVWDALFKRNACEFAACQLDDYFAEGFTCTAEGHDPGCHTPSESNSAVMADHCFQRLFNWIASELKPAYWLLFAELEGEPWASLQPRDEGQPDEDGVRYERKRLYRRHR